VHRDHLVAEIEAFDSADPLDWKFIDGVDGAFAVA
jgi:hypothetical protein